MSRVSRPGRLARSFIAKSASLDATWITISSRSQIVSHSTARPRVGRASALVTSKFSQAGCLPLRLPHGALR